MRRNTALLDLTAPGWVILACMGLLCAFGIATIHVADTGYAAGFDGPLNARKQAIILAGALVLSIGVLKLGYRGAVRWAYPFFILALLLLIPPVAARYTGQNFGGLVPIIKGARRWIRLPFFQLQPSEVMKIALIVALAFYLRYRRNFRTLRGLITPILVAFVPLALILLEPDLGSALLILPLVFIMLYTAGAKVGHLAAVAGIGLMLAPLAWTRIEDYQRRRITAVLLQSQALREAVRESPQRFALLATPRDAVEWSLDSGYQLVRSKIAIGSGGAFGEGWGVGPFVQHQILPEGHNDFVFSLIAHQWGLAGCVIVLAAYAGIIGAGAVIATATREPFGRLVCVGVIALLGMQVVVNVGMTLGLAPVTGVTLPLVSYGGCSLVVNVLMLALLVSISQHRPFLLAGRPFNFALRQRRAIQLELVAQRNP